MTLVLEGLGDGKVRVTVSAMAEQDHSAVGVEQLEALLAAVDALHAVQKDL
jgi:hypothetical protein